jgi:hypothetical protein
MKMLYQTICLSLSIAAISGTAFADEVKPDACAASLSPTGKTIFEAVAPSVEADTNLKELLKKKVRPLVMSGKLKRKDAKANAPLAGECLLLLKQQKQDQTGA